MTAHILFFFFNKLCVSDFNIGRSQNQTSFEVKTYSFLKKINHRREEKQFCISSQPYLFAELALLPVLQRLQHLL